MFSELSRLNQKPLFLEFSGFCILFSFQCSLLLPQQQLLYLITVTRVCQQLFYFIFQIFKFLCWFDAPFFKASIIISKACWKVNTFFHIFSFFAKRAKVKRRGTLSSLSQPIPYHRSLTPYLLFGSFISAGRPHKGNPDPHTIIRSPILDGQDLRSAVSRQYLLQQIKLFLRKADIYGRWNRSLCSS